MKFCRIIGDVHQNENFYLNLVKGCEYSLQLGDMGFSYKWLEKAGLDPNKHKFFGGNHENMDKYYESPYSLGDFGIIPYIKNSFFLRGGFSIDVAHRIPKVSWWENEQLSENELEEAYEMYCDIKPKYLFAHECPLSLVHLITDGRVAKAFGFPPIIETYTNIMLNKMIKSHKPEIFFHGHYHRDFDEVIDGTRFICLTSDGRDVKQKSWDLEV